MSGEFNLVNKKNFEIINGKGIRAAIINGEYREVVDFFSDFGVLSLGYGCDLRHVPNIFQSSDRDTLVDALTEISGLDRVFFCNSGTEAVEAAIKLARQASGKKTILYLPGDFHGRTYGALSVSDVPSHYKEGFEPFLPNTEMIDFDFNTIKNRCEKGDVAGLIADTHCCGGADFRIRDLNVYKKIKEMENTPLLILDEIQTYLHCGNWFAYQELFGFLPDIVCIAKGAAAGYPFGAMLAKEELAWAFSPGSHFSTFGGNIVAVEKAIEVIDCYDVNRFTLNVVAQILRDGLCDLFWDVEVKGLIASFGVPKKFIGMMFEQGYLLSPLKETRVKIVLPLIIKPNDVKTFLGVCQDVLRKSS